MGNSQSSDHDSKSTAHASPSSPAASKHAAGVRRKESVHALANAKSATPPTSLITSSSGSAAALSTHTNAHAAVPASSHSRARSITASSGSAKARLDDTASSHKSDSSSMGGDQSKQQRPPSARSTPLPTPAPIARPQTTDAPADEKPTPSPSARPVDVPQAPNHRLDSENFFPSGQVGSGSPYGLPPSNYSRPPRLPLPIEEEIHTPGSPIIRPEELGPPIEQAEPHGLRRRASVLSSTTADDEEIGDQDAFSAEQSSIAPSVPTKIDWNGYGDRVYVTGTFVQWDRKFRLHRDKEKGYGFTATLPLKPGTHHIKFLVDGDMITANDLPTTVDYTNILVNYIEVVAPMPLASDAQEPEPAAPMPIPGTAITEGQATGTAEPAAGPLDTPAPVRAPETEADITPNTAADAAPEVAQPITIPHGDHTSRSESLHQETQEHKPVKQILPRPKYTNQIPQFLLDLDTYNDPGNERFRRSSQIVGNLPQPPSLPMFLGKSILNGATPHKDDASVLIMPNHTVLNHLATSSIKNGVLATSGTTRYKRKFLTTIMYKPTSDDG